MKPVRFTLRSQIPAEEISERTFRLKRNEEFCNVFIKKSLNKEERIKLKELQQEVRMRNQERTEEEKIEFFLESNEWESGEVVPVGSELKQLEVKGRNKGMRQLCWDGWIDIKRV